MSSTIFVSLGSAAAGGGAAAADSTTGDVAIHLDGPASVLRSSGACQFERCELRRVGLDREAPSGGVLTGSADACVRGTAMQMNTGSITRQKERFEMRTGRGGGRDVHLPPWLLDMCASTLTAIGGTAKGTLPLFGRCLVPRDATSLALVGPFELCATLMVHIDDKEA